MEFVINKMKISNFIGRQFSRLKMGMSYILLIVSTITAMSLINLAFPEIDTWMIFMLFPFVIFGSVFLGYIMDKTNVSVIDTMKTLDMTARFINVADLKSYEFWRVNMIFTFKLVKSIMDGKEISFDEWENEYQKFIKKWSQK